jgi:hypothetical protein
MCKPLDQAPTGNAAAPRLTDSDDTVLNNPTSGEIFPRTCKLAHWQSLRVNEFGTAEGHMHRNIKMAVTVEAPI